MLKTHVLKPALSVSIVSHYGPQAELVYAETRFTASTGSIEIQPAVKSDSSCS